MQEEELQELAMSAEFGIEVAEDLQKQCPEWAKQIDIDLCDIVFARGRWFLSEGWLGWMIFLKHLRSLVTISHGRVYMSDDDIAAVVRAKYVLQRI